MGWNDVEPSEGNGLFSDLSSGARFYFLHSYYFRAASEEHVLAVTDYRGDICVERASGERLWRAVSSGKEPPMGRQAPEATSPKSERCCGRESFLACS